MKRVEGMPWVSDNLVTSKGLTKIRTENSVASIYATLCEA